MRTCVVVGFVFAGNGNAKQCSAALNFQSGRGMPGLQTYCAKANPSLLSRFRNKHLWRKTCNRRENRPLLVASAGGSGRRGTRQWALKALEAPRARLATLGTQKEEFSKFFSFQIEAETNLLTCNKNAFSCCDPLHWWPELESSSGRIVGHMGCAS